MTEMFLENPEEISKFLLINSVNPASNIKRAVSFIVVGPQRIFDQFKTN